MVEEPDLREIGAGFEIDGTWLRATRYGSGHINQTYLAEFDQGGQVVRYVHQAINEEIFQDVPGLMGNVDRVTTHLRKKAAAAEGGPRWEVPGLVPARDGGLVWRDAAGRCWRTWTHIENARTYDSAPNPDVAREAARAFGRFVRELADLDPSLLVESIPRFHDLDGRIARLRGVVATDPVGRVAEVEAELEAVYVRVSIEEELRTLRASGSLPLRVTHNDTKVNNALLDEQTGLGVAVIDLDTVMPGTLLFDYGDLVRTATCGAAEDERDLRQVGVDVEMFRAVTEGFLSEVSSIATSAEIDNLLLGGRFMTFIVGLRFLTDYLEGDPYFRTTRPGQNLDRARTQLTLLHSLESNSDILSECIEAVR